MINLFKRIFSNAELRQSPYVNGFHAMEHSYGQTNVNSEKKYSINWDVLNEKLELSSGAIEIFELPWDKLLTYQDMKSMIYPEDFEHVRKIVSTIFVKKFFPDFYCRIITPKNHVKHIYVTGDIVLNEQGQLAFIKGEIRDVSEQGLYIQKIQLQNQKLQDIAWLQSHKMRSPVATIMGLIQLFNCEDPNDPINVKVLEGVKEAANSLDSVIKEINDKTETLKLVS